MPIDFRLLEVSMELNTLQEHLTLIEEQIKKSQEDAKRKLEADLEKLPPDDRGEHQPFSEEYDYRVRFVLPRSFRNPFLVILFAVYESVVTEIAGLIQEKIGQQISLKEINGDLLERVKKYYKHILKFEPSRSNKSWQRLMLLSDLRNAIAHRNGRLDLVGQSTRKRILTNKGIKEYHVFLIVNERFLRETFDLVKEELEDLVARYKEWDTEYRASQ